MSRRDPWISLRQMLDHAEEALALSVGRTKADFESDRLFYLALVRLLEVTGEAANRVPREVQASHPGIAWPELIAMRNRLIHGYDMIDRDALWRAVEQRLPDLVDQLQRALASTPKPPQVELFEEGDS